MDSIIYNSDVDDMDSIILSFRLSDNKYIKKLLRNHSYMSKRASHKNHMFKQRLKWFIVISTRC